MNPSSIEGAEQPKHDLFETLMSEVTEGHLLSLEELEFVVMLGVEKYRALASCTTDQPAYEKLLVFFQGAASGKPGALSTFCYDMATKFRNRSVFNQYWSLGLKGLETESPEKLESAARNWEAQGEQIRKEDARRRGPKTKPREVRYGVDKYPSPLD